MAISIDPEGAEIRLLKEFAAPLGNTRVLEIGCGDGRLTWRYASLVGRVVAIDPKLTLLEQAKARLPEILPDKIDQITFINQTLDEYSSHTNLGERFDRVFLAWSL